MKKIKVVEQETEKNLEVSLGDTIKVEDAVFGISYYLVVKNIYGDYTVLDLEDCKLFGTAVSELSELLDTFFGDEEIEVMTTEKIVTKPK